MSEAQQSISDEYIPNQPIGAQFFLPVESDQRPGSSQQYLYSTTSNLMRTNPEVLRYHPPIWSQIQHAREDLMLNRAEYEDVIHHGTLCYGEVDSQTVPSLVPCVSIHHHQDYKTDFVSMTSTSTDPVASLARGDHFNFSKSDSNILGSHSGRDSAKSLKDLAPTWRMQCRECHKRFNSMVNLKNHVDTAHKGMRPFKCEVCKKTFAQSATLRTHNRVHTGEKPYKCSICERRFADLSTCKKHQRVHDGQKPYECDICNKRFSQSGNMIRHRDGHERRESRINITTITTISATRTMSGHQS